MINAIKFPDMLSPTGVSQLVFDKDATSLNLRCLLLSTKQTLLGDPYFGVNLRNLLFEKNNIILRDLVIDDILTNINTYLPQILVERKNIEVNSDGKKVFVKIDARNIIDYSLETYNLKLLDVEEI